MAKKPDCSGYATKANLKCSDGRVILPDAFKECDGKRVPLVWQHLKDSPDNVLGHAILENRKDGVYSYLYFNEDTDSGRTAKNLVKHGDITAMSVFANNLIEKSKRVAHGIIREVSLVYAGANPGASIDNLAFEHGDGSIEADLEQAYIYSGEALVHENENEKIVHVENEDDDEDKTISDVFNTLNMKQKDMLYAIVTAVAEEATAKHSAIDDGDNDDDNDEGDDTMKHNVFEQDAAAKKEQEKNAMTHAEFASIINEAKSNSTSLKATYLAHAGDYGIDNIDYLFPDARNVTPTPDMISRRMEWVSGVLNGTKHSPFARIKSIAADITADEARAKGYVKGNLKKEEVFALLKRVTLPSTIYKKQKLDRDDIIDIVDIDVVAWLKKEMRVMLDEEIARAVLVGDGREADSEDKISETTIRPIYTDDDMYAFHVEVPKLATPADLIEIIIRSRVKYRGSGNPTLYTTSSVLADMLLLCDTTGRRIYSTIEELKSVLRVRDIVEVPVMEGIVRDGKELLGIFVNLNDYTIGADKGGAVALFDDFDIDYNQYKYLIETRISGALTHPLSALVFERSAEGEA